MNQPSPALRPDPVAEIVRSRLSPRAPVAVFDLDGTLVDTAPDLCASLNHCLSTVGLGPVALADVRPHAGKGVAAMLAHAYAAAAVPLDADLRASQTACFLAYYGAHIADHSVPFAGAVEALSRLAAAGFTLAVCTNKTEHLARRLLNELGLADRFAAICGADTFSNRKPDPVHLLGTLERAGGAEGGAVMIGDTLTDIDAALALALPSVLVNFGYETDSVTHQRATCVIEHFDALTPALLHSLARVAQRSA